MPRTALLLDVGGVFLVPHPEPVTDVLTPAGISHDISKIEYAHYCGVAAIDRDDGPGEDRRSYLDAYVRGLDVVDDDVSRAVDALDAIWSMSAFDLWRHVLRPSVDALPRLRDAFAKLGIVSNSDGSVEEQLRRNEICQVGEGLGVPVLAIIDSHIVGVEKPDAAIFTPALEKLSVAAEDALFVGDSRRYDVAGARAAGLHPVHLDPHSLCPHPDDHDHVRTLSELAS